MKLCMLTKLYLVQMPSVGLEIQWNMWQLAAWKLETFAVLCEMVARGHWMTLKLMEISCTLTGRCFLRLSWRSGKERTLCKVYCLQSMDDHLLPWHWDACWVSNPSYSPVLSTPDYFIFTKVRTTLSRGMCWDARPNTCTLVPNWVQ
jgi:hypothetical protein